ncbi:N-acyl-D-amino-acid deacylase family protein [Parahaliea aestuarii]|uniref:Amidohydrolase family protein n=1 Tax=Parahaliea aestuarii TaxID=1852021 RepID=A0A5C8ZNC4_9GAMM|nr:amidohydrolase family protein [Parahaliea aestuarii]TXS90006.1 amidohydrolase family protein [Parahaliea aestuarii]
MYDTLIINGTLVDGTGAPARRADVAIRNGRIAAIGTDLGEARETIDAGGALVTPGWVDTHSHMDGQATWDALCSPAAHHGITTLIMGNCGVGFAPCRADDRERQRMIEVMEDVEDIPGAALAEGIQWQWESFPEYLDALDRKPRAIDIGAQVPHCAVRTYVMGQRGVNNEPASEDDVRQMAAIVREGIEAGAIGFTTSRTKLHTTRDGQVMPGTYSDAGELLGIGSAIGQMGKGIYGLVSDFDDWEEEMAWMKQLSIDNNCQVNFVLFFREESDWERVQKQLAYVREARKEGARLIPHVGARPVNILMGWDGTVNPFMFHQHYAPLAGLSREERLEQLRKPEVREAIINETPIDTGGDFFLNAITRGYDNLYVMGDTPNYEPRYEDSIEYMAQQAGVSSAAYAYDALLANGGTTLLYCPLFGYDSRDLSRQFAMLKDENSVLSLADTGAHCGVLCDASVPTYLLSYLVRDRASGGRLGLEEAVKMHTHDTARCMGLDDRGTLEPGMKADINIIDFNALQVKRPEIIFDLPAGGRRVFQGAEGYRYTLVGGEIIMRDGEPTGRLPGKLIRGAQQAPAAAAA